MSQVQFRDLTSEPVFLVCACWHASMHTSTCLQAPSWAMVPHPVYRERMLACQHAQRTYSLWVVAQVNHLLIPLGG